MDKTDNEKRLWSAVFFRAILDLKKKKHKADAQFWFLRSRETGAGSFPWICELLGLDRKRVLNVVFAWGFALTNLISTTEKKSA